MAARFVLAKTTDSNRLKKGNGGKKFDYLATFCRPHLTLISSKAILTPWFLSTPQILPRNPKNGLI